MDVTEFVAGATSALNQWDALNSSLLKGGAALTAAVTVPIVGLGTAALGMAGLMTSASMGFETMLGSAEAAGEFLGELKDFAAKTPFEFKDLVTSAQRMKAL